MVNARQKSAWNPISFAAFPADTLPERDMPEQSSQSYRGMTAQIVASYVRHHRLSPDQIAPLIPAVYRALSATAVSEDQTATVRIRESIHRDHLACLECGFAATSLPLHLRTVHGLTPDQYREKWKLSPAYPMVSPAYSEHRSMLAKKFGLGRKGKEERASDHQVRASKGTRPTQVSKRQGRPKAAT
jgi:predicted transcriptional regulator